jgi:hypothetical protein
MPSPAEYWQYTPTEIRFSHRPNQPLFVLHQVGEDPTRMRVVSHQEARTARDREQILPPWDMLFRVSGRALAQRFEIRVTENEHLMDWSFVPRQRGDIGQFRETRVLMDKATWLPLAVQLLSTRGDIETVYTFQYTQVRRQPAGVEPHLLPLKQESPKLQPAPTDLHGQP